MRFANQVAIVTGSGRGIGRAIALRLASEGARIAVVSRTEKNSIAVAEEINGKHAGLAKPYAVDAADHAAVQSLCAQIIADFTRVDVLVNNAGVTKDGLSMRMSSNDWDTVIATNLKGAFNFYQGVVRTMMKQRSGSIINIASVSGLMGNAGQANYAASKAGIFGFTKSIAKEVGSRNIRCNAVAPGFIETEMTQGLDDKTKDAYFANIPLKRFGRGDEIANTCVFLGSDLSSYITGEVITVSGGMG